MARLRDRWATKLALRISDAWLRHWRAREIGYVEASYYWGRVAERRERFLGPLVRLLEWSLR